MNNNGIISTPISIRNDVSKVLNITKYNLASTNSSGNNRALSIYKPVIYPSVTSVPDINAGVVTDAWYDGIDCYGIYKPNIRLAAGQWAGTLGGQGGNVLGGSFNNIIASYIVANSDGTYSQSPHYWDYKKPTGGATSPYRISDYRNYSHLDDYYPDTQSKIPFTVTCTLNRVGDTVLNASALIRYNKDDVIRSGSAGSLGMSKLFNINYSGKIYFGVAVYAPTNGTYAAFTTNRRIPFSIMGITSSYLGARDPMTGSDNMISVSTGNISCIGGTAASPASDKFYIGEKVIVVPFLVRQTTSNNFTYYKIMGLSCFGNIAHTINTISGSIIGTTYASVSSMSVTLTRLSNSNGTLTFYIAATSGLRLVAGSAGALTFRSSLSIGPGDGTTNVSSTVPGYFSGSKDADGFTYITVTSGQVLDASRISGWSTSTTPASRPPSVTLTPTVSSFKVNASMTYQTKDGAKTINGSTTYSGQDTITINLS